MNNNALESTIDAPFAVEEPEMLAALSESEKGKLTELLDEYLCNLERGIRLNIDDLTATHPELAGAFVHYVAKLDTLHEFAGIVPVASRTELDPGIDGKSAYQLGDFAVIRELGRGGMGTVYEAHQLSLDRRVAIKLLPMASMLDSRQISRFKNESRAAGQLHHPHIVPIHSVGCENGIHFYAMQLVDGVSIDAWIRHQHDTTSSPDSWRETVQWAVSIADALQCAHESGVVHRDVKPSNLMLDSQGKIWITDFGLARCQSDLTLTRSGDVMGTMRYMSPEQASGRSEMIDHRTDIYSLGATLFEMLTLRAAIEGEDSATLLRRITQDEPPRLKALREDVPTELSVVLQKAMAKRKDDRYESAQQFGVDLQSVLDGRATHAQPPSTITVATRWVTRHQKSVAVGTSVFVVAMLWLSISSVIIFRKGRAEQASAVRAEQYFDQARTTVDDLGSRVADQLSAVPGTESIRRSLLKDTLAYYQQFIAQASGDPKLQIELAATNTRIGNLLAELEGPLEAIPYYRQAESTFALLSSVEASHSATQAKIAENLNRLGLALADTGALSEAFAAYREATSIQQRLVNSRPANARSAIELATTFNNLGLLFRKMRRPEDARDQFKKAIAQLAAVHVEGDDAVLATRGHAAALANLSSLTIESDPQESADLLEQAIDLRLASLSNRENRLRASGEVAVLYNNLGSSRMRSRQLEQAASAFNAAVRLQRQLLAIAPLVEDHRRNLAMSLNNLAMVWQKQSKAYDAVESFREAVRIQSELVAAHDDSKAVGQAPDISRLGAIEHNLALSLVSMQRDSEAEAILNSAIEHQRDACSIAPDWHDSRDLLRQHYQTLMQSQVRSGRWSDARVTETAMELAARSPTKHSPQETTDAHEVIRP